MEDLEEYKKQAADKFAKRKIKEMEDWCKLPRFNTPDDVPNIPIIENEAYQMFYTTKLIESGAIPKNKLIDGKVYIGKHRRCTRAKWNKKKNTFEYFRYKFGWCMDECNHFEDDNGFALFVPIKLDDNQDFDIPEKI